MLHVQLAGHKHKFVFESSDPWPFGSRILATSWCRMTFVIVVPIGVQDVIWYPFVMGSSDACGKLVVLVVAGGPTSGHLIR